MPFARNIVTVAMIFRAATVIEMAKMMMVKQYASMPVEKDCTESGAYPVHPVGKPPRNRVEKKIGMAEKSSQ